MKILLISHNPISTYNNMGKTFLRLFSDFKPDELCQLYLYPDNPDTDCCCSYYRFTDRDALRSLVSRSAVGGEVLPASVSLASSSTDKEQRAHHSVRSRANLIRLARDLLWHHSRWNNASLHEWLERQAPELIFVAPGAQELLYDIAMSIAREMQLPMVTYVCDDFYFAEAASGFWGNLRRKRLRGKISALARESSMTITICPELAYLYQERLGVSAMHLLACPAFSLKPVKSSYRDTPRHMTYMGNLSCGRGQSLFEIGQTLDYLNKNTSSDYSLDIYTNSERKELLQQLASCPAIRLHGFVTGDEYAKVFDGAEAFVHVESFEERNRERVRYSVSTKIIECLASGKPLIAYGPKDVASMAYLRRNGCAFLAQSQDDLLTLLIDELSDERRLREIIYNAEQTAKCEAENSRTLHSFLAHNVLGGSR